MSQLSRDRRNLIFGRKRHEAVGFDGVNGYRLIVDRGMNAFELGGGHGTGFFASYNRSSIR
jgi:hypothetical protein